LASDNLHEYLLFLVSEKLYAISLIEVKGIIEYQGCSKLPLLRANFVGFSKIEGKPVPVCDLITALSGREHRPSAESHIIVVSRKGVQIALLINDVIRIIKVKAAHDHMVDRHEEKISWQGKDVHILNTDELFYGNVKCGMGIDDHADNP